MRISKREEKSGVKMRGVKMEGENKDVGIRDEGMSENEHMWIEVEKKGRGKLRKMRRLRG